MPFATGRDALPRDPAPHVQRRCKCNNRRSYWCTKSEARIAVLLRILAGCAARGGRIPAVVFDRRATKQPAKIRAALRVGAAPAPRRVAGSLNRTSAIRLASEGGEAKVGAFAYAPCESSGGAPNTAIPASDLVH